MLLNKGMLRKLMTSKFDLITRVISVLFGFFILIPFKFKPYLVVLVLLWSIISIIVRSHKIVFSLKKTIPIVIVFIIYLISLFNTTNLERGFILLGRMSPLLIIPISLSVLSQNIVSKFFHFFSKSFIISCTIYSILIFYYLFQLGSLTGLHTLGYGYSYITFEFSGLNEHPIYISSYFGTALLLLLFKTFNSKKTTLVLFFIIFSGLLILSRKGSVLSFLFCFLLYYFMNNNIRTIIKIVPILLVFTAVFFMIPEIRNRFLEIIDSSNFVSKNQTSTSIRFTIWTNTIDLIKNAPFFGYGVGDVQDVDNNNYIKKGLVEFSKNKYNAHNQYFQIGLVSGIMGLMIFLYSQLALFINVFKKKNFQFAMVILFFFILFMTESYLERQNGIIFYSMIMSLFIYSNSNVKDAK